MKKIQMAFLILGALCLAALPAFAEEALLKTQITLGQNSVKSGMMFLATARVSTQSDVPVTMMCHSCSYEKQWTVDTPNVFLQPWTCHEDSMEKATIDATTSYEKNLILYITKTGESAPVTFRLGFIQILENGDEMEPVWSNPVTLHVVAAEPPADAGSGSGPDRSSEVELSESMPDEAMEHAVT